MNTENETSVRIDQNQMELGFSGSNRCPRVAHRERRLNHANWWFNQMRQVVERAADWEPAPRFQTEQILFAQDGMRMREAHN